MVIGKYRNGNYNVMILDDGTKMRFNNEDHFQPEFPESMDIKITNQCDMGCPFCHEDSKPDGIHGDIMNAKFIESLHPYTELAIGGGNPLSHPDLIKFLKKCKDLKLIPSMTVNQTHFMKDFDKIKKLCDEHLIYGLGISLVLPEADFIERVKQISNAVIHVIAGATPIRQVNRLKDLDLKILILGYKDFRRGEQFHKGNKSKVDNSLKSYKKALPELVNHFKVVSFDNLAIKQLDVQSILSKEQWDQFYMGDDGQFTMYIDMVNKEFASSSTSVLRFDLTDNIREMFAWLQEI